MTSRSKAELETLAALYQVVQDGVCCVRVVDVNPRCGIVTCLRPSAGIVVGHRGVSLCSEHFAAAQKLSSEFLQQLAKKITA